MVWKLLSALSAVCLGVACYFAWANQKALSEERKREAYYVANLEKIKEHKVLAEEAKKNAESRLAEINKELETTKATGLEVAGKVQVKEQELALAKTNLEQTTKVVNDLQKLIADAGDIENLLAQIDTIKKDRSEAEAALANQNQRFAAAQERVNSLNKAAKEAEEREARGRRGIVDSDFTAKVAKSYSDWGFVVLNKGNGGGVFANADLEVKRGKDVIAKLKVRNVEQNSSVAELIPGSLTEGQAIRNGDIVVAAAEQTIVKPKAGAAAAPAAGAEAAPAPAAGAAPAANDPFAAPAGGAAPAPMGGGDPFGAPAAPAANSDPFGAPAAPAAGTPAAPSNVDPFGAAPAKP